jgi:hypothetical protein
MPHDHDLVHVHVRYLYTVYKISSVREYHVLTFDTMPVYDRKKTPGPSKSRES